MPGAEGRALESRMLGKLTRPVRREESRNLHITGGIVVKHPESEQGARLLPCTAPVCWRRVQERRCVSLLARRVTVRPTLPACQHHTVSPSGTHPAPAQGAISGWGGPRRARSRTCYSVGMPRRTAVRVHLGWAPSAVSGVGGPREQQTFGTGLPHATPGRSASRQERAHCCKRGGPVRCSGRRSLFRIALESRPILAVRCVGRCDRSTQPTEDRGRQHEPVGKASERRVACW